MFINYFAVTLAIAKSCSVFWIHLVCRHNHCEQLNAYVLLEKSIEIKKENMKMVPRDLSYGGLKFLLYLGGLLASIVGIGFILALGMTSNEPKNQVKRLGYLVGFSGCTGLSLGPLLDHVIAVDPQIISTAFFASALIFVCFSLTALWADDRSYLYLGGTLMSALSIMSFMMLMNIFFRSTMMFQVMCQCHGLHPGDKGWNSEKIWLKGLIFWMSRVA